MSILDGLPKNEAEYTRGLEFANSVVDKMLASSELTVKQRSLIELQREGMSLADILGLKKEHLDAMFIQAYRMMEAGEIAKAQEAFVGLIQMEPTEALPFYALGCCYQAQGDFEAAGKMFVQFLTLDGSNGAGYLRIGECFLANGEINEARDSFGAAKHFAAKSGDTDTIDQADRLLATLATRSAE